MKTFLANLQHAANSNKNTIFGNVNLPPEHYRNAADTIRDMTETLAQMAFTVETVAHLRGMELELLPVADKARAILARVRS